MRLSLSHQARPGWDAHLWMWGLGAGGQSIIHLLTHLVPAEWLSIARAWMLLL